MENEDLNDAAIEQLMRRLDNIERNMAGKGDVMFAVLMAHVFTVLVLAGTVVLLEMIVEF
ncbi:hypothetical protein [Aliiroseovarius sp. 2305UL8-7]|uniref:hypothetical protein n=1 Tax=Aliiroseovarius conchicola TaxID=3121637 RepID=UPI0035271F49